MASFERLVTMHNRALSAHYGDKLNKMYFDAPYKPEKDNDTVISNSTKNRVAFVTRHLLTSEVTHAIIFDREWYERV